MIVEVSDSDFHQAVKNGLVVVDFYADWCVPCRKIDEILKEISKNYNGNLKIVKVNVEKTSISSAFGVSSLPTLIFFKDGKPIANLIGAKPKSEIEKAIKKLL